MGDRLSHGFVVERFGDGDGTRNDSRTFATPGVRRGLATVYSTIWIRNDIGACRQHSGAAGRRALQASEGDAVEAGVHARVDSRTSSAE